MVSFEFEEIARCGSSYGVKGGIKFAGEESELERCLEEGFVFIRLEDGSPVPFRIRSVEHKASYILYLETIETPEQAKELSDRPILLPKDSKSKANKDKSKNTYADLIGFELYDTESEKKSRIVDVLDYPGQTMAIMEAGELIPLHDDLIIEIEPENKKITVSLADGIWAQS